jgi:hypothetical protein
VNRPVHVQSPSCLRDPSGERRQTVRG